jgi:hypothetical protein
MKWDWYITFIDLSSNAEIEIWWYRNARIEDIKHDTEETKKWCYMLRVSNQHKELLAKLYCDEDKNDEMIVRVVPNWVFIVPKYLVHTLI